MQDTQSLNRIHATMAWGAIFTWWGIAELLNLANGMDALGIGLIVLGLVAWRRSRGLPSNGFTITLGILALVWGVLDLSRSVLQMPLGVATEFAILLVVVGLTLLGLGLRARSIDQGLVRR